MSNDPLLQQPGLKEAGNTNVHYILKIDKVPEGIRSHDCCHGDEKCAAGAKRGGLTLHQELSHRLASIGLNLVVPTVLLRGVVDDQDVFASVFLEAILERFISDQLHAIFLPVWNFIWQRLKCESITFY